MQINVVPQNISRKLLITMPGLCTALTAASVVFLRTAPLAWRTDTIKDLTGGVLVSLSTLSFLAICKYSGSE
ncbi:MAG: hypothetical protein ACRYFU_11175 [Janthinobacterium lividum]